MSKRKSPKTPFDVGDFIKSSEQDLGSAVESLLESKTGSPAAPQEERSSSAIQPAVSVRRMLTLSQHGEQSMFLVDSDALKLVIDLTAAHELVNADARFHANFQLVDYSTGLVHVNHWSENLTLQWGHEFWISLGSNEGPDPSHYTTPAKWGLVPGLYIFRSLIEFGRTVVYSPAKEIAIRISAPHAAVRNRKGS